MSPRRGLGGTRRPGLARADCTAAPNCAPCARARLRSGTAPPYIGTMAAPRDPMRRFGDKDIAVILKRAAELQHHDPVAVTEGSGLSLGELETIAHEAGIDRRYVRQAAEELDTGPRSGAAFALLGGPIALDVKRTVAGAASASTFDRLAAEIQQTLGELGASSILGRSLSWHSTNMQRPLQVSVTPREGRTEIRAQEKLGNLAGGLFGGIVGGMGGGGMGVALGVGIGALALPPALAVAAAGAIMVGSYALARGIYVAQVRRKSEQLRLLVEQLAERVTDAAG